MPKNCILLVDMPDFRWYKDRFKAMSREVRKARVRQFFRRWKDWWTLPDFRQHSMSMEPRERAFPEIPPREEAPEELKSALRFDSDRILAGSTTVFKQISLKVKRHPTWQNDY